MKIIDSNLPPPIERPSLLRRLLDRFCDYETMSGNGACPVYLERWVLKEIGNYGAYLHHFIGDDWAIDPHDHPRRFISIGLKGWYYEDVFSPERQLNSARDTLREGDQFAISPTSSEWLTLKGLAQGESFIPAFVYRRPAQIQTFRFKAPWFRSFPAEHLHRVRASECGDCWTLVIVLPKSRRWGFVRDGVWIPFKEYVFGGKSRKSC